MPNGKRPDGYRWRIPRKRTGTSAKSAISGNVIDFGFKNVFKRVLNLKVGDFLFYKNQNKAFRKGINLYFCHPFKKGNREVAQAGSAPGLGPGGRRFESCLPDTKVRPDQIGFSKLKRIASILIGAFLTKSINSVIFSR